MGENKHLTPVWIVYVDGERLDPMYEGALERIVIDDKLNGVGTGVLEFDSFNDKNTGQRNIFAGKLCVSTLRV